MLIFEGYFLGNYTISSTYNKQSEYFAKELNLTSFATSSYSKQLANIQYS
jgi:hypothetical protein